MKNSTVISIIALGTVGVVAMILIMHLHFRVLQLEYCAKQQLKINENALFQLQTLTKDRDDQLKLTEMIVHTLEKNLK